MIDHRSYTHNLSSYFNEVCVTAMINHKIITHVVVTGYLQLNIQVTAK